MDECYVVIQEILEKQMKLLENDLGGIISNKYSQALIQFGSWQTPKYQTAYISIFPFGNKSEKSVDAIIRVEVLESGVNFGAGVCVSDGEIIANIMDEKINVINNNTFAKNRLK